MKYELEYYENGEIKKDYINIDFISNGMLKQYNNIVSDMMDIKKMWDRISNLNSIIAANKKEKKNNIGIYKDEINELTEKIKNFNKEDFFKLRFDLLCDILSKNLVKNKKYYDYEFWNNDVDSSVLVKFLDEIISKDLSKKKVLNQ